MHKVFGAHEEWDYITLSHEILQHANAYWVDAVNHRISHAVQR